MTPEEEQQFAYTIYKRILDSLTGAADSVPAIFDDKQTMLCLQIPAQAVSAEGLPERVDARQHSG